MARVAGDMSRARELSLRDRLAGKLLAGRLLDSHPSRAELTPSQHLAQGVDRRYILFSHLSSVSARQGQAGRFLCWSACPCRQARSEVSYHPHSLASALHFGCKMNNIDMQVAACARYAMKRGHAPASPCVARRCCCSAWLTTPERPAWIASTAVKCVQVTTKGRPCHAGSKRAEMLPVFRSHQR